MTIPKSSSVIDTFMSARLARLSQHLATNPAVTLVHRGPLTRMMSSLPPAPPGPAVHITDKYVFFYGYELQIPEGRLQMWYPSSFTDLKYSGIRFQTAEHYVMYRKALTFDDKTTADRILIAATPREANKLGREVQGFKPDVWRSKVDDIAEECNYLKFSQVWECKVALLETGDKTLAEASPVDRNWGIGFAGDKAEGHEEEWGRNLLGKALMKVRERLRKEGTT